jgi:hypothetical protein
MTQFTYRLPGGATFVMDSAEVGALLKSNTLTDLLSEAANAVAQQLGARGVTTVWVDRYTTDRKAAAVTIPGYGTGAEMIHGLLADAAASVGLEVHRS